MKSYSKVFKASHLSVLNDVKVVNQPFIPNQTQTGDQQPVFSHDELTEQVQLVQQQLQEAEEKAATIVMEAENYAQSLKAAAQEEINSWWEEKQFHLEQMMMEMKQQGYQEGFDQGKMEGVTAVEEDFQEKTALAQQVLEHAYSEKEAIVAEAEPFLLEISTAIATQILKQELDSKPDKFIELIKQHILRFKEKEFITVCVHPDDFDFVLSQRLHLVAVVNGETEIKIIPDHSVTSKGCVIRTAYGSVDARIDTQMEEIKKVMLEARREPENGAVS
ncbi:FliH/SctL family protein [Neobacillus sp. LXY-1]|uniref:FliH/SctL family protein n=1 Tax=Neobacillus sp. LXY-1 TaxID=3379133 RepID=UPI003EDFDCCF